MKTNAVNIKHGKYDVYTVRAGRGQDGYSGNPFPLQAGETWWASLEKYRAYFLSQAGNRTRVTQKDS